MTDTTQIVRDMLSGFTTGFLTADYTNGSKTRSAMVTIHRLDPATGARRAIETRSVTGKREARALAAKIGGKCWNF